MEGKKRGKGTLIRCVISVYTQMCVHVCFTVYKREKARQTESRQRAREEEEEGGGVLPEGECWNIEHVVLI